MVETAMNAILLIPIAFVLLIVFFFGGIVLIPGVAALGLLWAMGALLTRWIHRKP